MLSEFTVERIEKSMEFWSTDRQRHLNTAMTSTVRAEVTMALQCADQSAFHAFSEIGLLIANDKVMAG